MILIVARDEGLRLRVADALRDTRWGAAVMNVTSVGEAQQLLSSGPGPSVVIVGEGIGATGAADIVAASINTRSAPPVLLVAQPTTEILRQAMRAGVRDVLAPTFEQADLVRAFEESAVSSEGPGAVPGCTVAIFSTKGGVGTSVIASNLAVRLSARTGAAATLIDLDLASADQAIMHGLSPRWTIQDLADGSVGLDTESLGQVLVPIEGSSALLLPGPLDPALAETITAGNVANVISAARASAPLAVLDTSSSFDDRTLAALDAADVIVVSSSLDVAALRSLSVSLQTLARLNIADDRILLAVSRSDSKSGLTLQDVERSVDRSVDVGVPSTRAVPRSVNEGIPIAIGSPRSSVVSAIDEIVDRVLEHAHEDFLAEVEDHAQSSGLSGLLPWSRSSRRTSTEDGGTPTPTTSPREQVTDVADEPAGQAPVASPAEDTTDDADEASEGNVVPIVGSGHQSAPSRPVRRTVRRSGPDSTDEDETVSGAADEARSEPTPESAGLPSLDALPPPSVVADDDEDDQPRRRRRR